MEQDVQDKQFLVETEERVISLMNREVMLSREILANMHGEERALLSEDDGALEVVLHERSAPLQELMEIREERLDAELALEQQWGSDVDLKQTSLNINYQDIESFEVLILRDQLVALIEKMNMQQHSNYYLSYLIRQHNYVPQRLLPPAPVLKVERRKSALATIPVAGYYD